MTFEEMRIAGRDAAQEAEGDPAVLLVAGLRDSQDAGGWKVYSWRGQPPSGEDALQYEELARLHALLSPEGTRFTWYMRGAFVAVFYVRQVTSARAEIVPLPVRGLSAEVENRVKFQGALSRCKAECIALVARIDALLAQTEEG
jgi:hypothetical protein